MAERYSGVTCKDCAFWKPFEKPGTAVSKPGFKECTNIIGMTLDQFFSEPWPEGFLEKHPDPILVGMGTVVTPAEFTCHRALPKGEEKEKVTNVNDEDGSGEVAGGFGVTTPDGSDNEGEDGPDSASP